MRAFVLIAILGLAAACGDDSSSQPGDDARDPIDAGLIDAVGVDASCFTNPQTHVEIINACTDAEKIYKTPVLPLLNPDGSLPPLP